MTCRPFDPALYLVTDRELAAGRTLDEIVGQALAGGVTMVQLREKQISTRDRVELAVRMGKLIRPSGAALIINDRVDVALAAEADGVHLGQEDMPAEVARRLIGHQRILGVTVADTDQARQAQQDGADYLGCNAVFDTPTKENTGSPMGLEGLARLVSVSTVPVVAIGGVRAENAAAVMATGVAGVAVVSAIVTARDPREAARELSEIVRSHRER
jgi:thiamine-phosphate pyrophosphorylase